MPNETITAPSSEMTIALNFMTVKFAISIHTRKNFPKNTLGSLKQLRELDVEICDHQIEYFMDRVTRSFLLKIL
jgi:hypothetical protein